MTKHKAKINRQNDLLEWIIQFMLDNGYVPSRKSMALYMGISSTTLFHWLIDLHGQQKINLLNKDATANTISIQGISYVDGRGNDE